MTLVGEECESEGGDGLEVLGVYTRGFLVVRFGNRLKSLSIVQSSFTPLLRQQLAIRAS